MKNSHLNSSISENPGLGFSVVVPTYKRPDYLRLCLDSLCVQIKKPREVCVVFREDDESSLYAYQQFLKSDTAQNSKIRFVMKQISIPGFLPPIQAGIEMASSDIVAFIDDDAVALPNWLAELEKCYEQHSIGGVGGRVINVKHANEETYYKPSKIAGRFSWCGRIVGNMYKDSYDQNPQSTDYFMGGNMSYRLEALKKIKVDFRFNNIAATNYEVDIGLQLKRLGYRLIYNPAAKIKHFSAAYQSSRPRQQSAESAYWQSFNGSYVAFKHTRGIQRCAVILYDLMIGQSSRWGVLSLLWHYLRTKTPPDFLTASLQGKIAALRAILSTHGDIDEKSFSVK